MSSHPGSTLRDAVKLAEGNLDTHSKHVVMNKSFLKKLALEAGFNVCTAAHTLSGVERSFSNKFSGAYPAEIVAHTLRMFGAGTKVAVECATMAADAGYIPVGEPVIARGGTGRGLDTAWILKAANTHTLLATRLEECLCKPLV